MKRLMLLACIASLACADEKTDHPTGPRITPPTINVVSPRGVARGMSVEMTVEGLNLAKASAVYFSHPGVKARILRIKELPDLPDVRLGANGTPSTIDLGPLPPRNQVTLEVDVAPDADVSEVKFRLQTPLGTSPEGTFLVEPYYGESPDREPNDTPDEAFESYLPTILVGAVSRPGDVDYYKIRVKAGEQVVFENGAMQLGSSLQPIVTILAEDQSLVKEFGSDGRTVSQFAHKFDKAGTYFVKVGDYQQSGRGSHTYRIKAGEFPLAASTYPLGLQKGKTAEIAVTGYHLDRGAIPVKKISVKGEPSPEDETAVIVRPRAPAGNSFNEVKLALGREPEVESANGTSLAQAQVLTVPVTINGKLPSANTGHYFRFKARKGEKLILEVNARRLGSELDSIVEVFDTKGTSIEQATVRAVWETTLTLRDHDSATAGLRIQAWNSIAVGDWVMSGGEILRVEAMPRTPDDDIRVETFGGQRLTFFNTSAESHAVDRAFYKVQVHPPGAQFTPNGLPLTRIYYRNDDGGPGYGKDSLLRFTAPADGEYIAMIRDVRGMGGDDFAYRLTLRQPRPDFRLAVTPRNPNVPLGGSVPVVATAFRTDDFDGPIEVTIEDLPSGLKATSGTIGRGQVSTVLLLSADVQAKLDRAVPLNVVGRAKIGAETIAHAANPDDKTKLVSVMPRPDILMTAVTREVVLEPGGTAEVKVAIKRQNGYGGRVPVQVRNLPPRVRVLDVGLNGVLLNEDENERSFTLEALPSAEPIDQLIYVAGDVETRSPLQSQYAAPQAILLKVRPNVTAQR